MVSGECAPPYLRNRHLAYGDLDDCKTADGRDVLCLPSYAVSSFRLISTRRQEFQVSFCFRRHPAGFADRAENNTLKRALTSVWTLNKTLVWIKPLFAGRHSRVQIVRRWVVRDAMNGICTHFFVHVLVNKS